MMLDIESYRYVVLSFPALPTSATTGSPHSAISLLMASISALWLVYPLRSAACLTLTASPRLNRTCNCLNAYANNYLVLSLNLN